MFNFQSLLQQKISICFLIIIKQIYNSEQQKINKIGTN